MLRLYDFLPSGNSYKVRLLIAQLKIPFERIEVNILQGETRTPEFLSKNPNVCIPVLEIEAGKFLFESNALLFDLSKNTEFFPGDAWQQAQIMQWLFFEQYSHEPFIATSRFWISILDKATEYQEVLSQKRVPVYTALTIMENHLKSHNFFVVRYTIADIGLFAYTHVADEGGFDLASFPAIQAWIERIKAMPQHISLTHQQ